MTSDCILRQGTPSDLTQILQLDQELIRYDSAFDPSLDAEWSKSEEARQFYSDRLNGTEGTAYVAENAEGSLIGFITGAEQAAESYRHPTRLAEIECFFVQDSYRGQRIGQKLLQLFSDWAQERGVERLSVTVSARNRQARDFYERYAFNDYDVVLEKSLKS